MQVSSKMVEENNDIGAIVLECTNMPPFAKDIQNVTGLPVFDIVSLTDMVFGAWNQRRYGQEER